jgi:hypothetical protein
MHLSISDKPASPVESTWVDLTSRSSPIHQGLPHGGGNFGRAAAMATQSGPRIAITAFQRSGGTLLAKPVLAAYQNEGYAR